MSRDNGGLGWAGVQGMRDMMRTSMARSLRTLSEEDRLAAALPLVCGSALAAHCEVERLENGELHLGVRGRDWLGPLLSMRDVLQRDLARTSGVKLETIHFDLMRRRPGSVPVAAVDAPVVRSGRVGTPGARKRSF